MHVFIIVKTNMERSFVFHRCIFVLGPLSGALVGKFGYRSTAIGGSLLASLGLAISAWTDNLYIFYGTFGVLTGKYVCVMIISSGKHGFGF